ncbi:MAG: response regulator transcription factor [Lachnospiraceae bacterium]|nr:response regulator transcription factor [Lachnospiraceae bacterium]
METYRILVVDDDREIVKSLARLLELEGYQVLKAYNGMQALEMVTERQIHLIILDVMMPQLNGLAALMKIREKNNIPIIMLSAKTEESDKVLGLTMGADDYVTKPYNTAELMARVKSQLRRYFSLGAVTAISGENILKNGGLVLDKNKKELTVDQEPVRLTATEYKIVELLMSHPGYVFSAEEIYCRVWQEDAYGIENTVMVHIRRIREKIEITPKYPKYLKVVWGIGYKIEKFDEKAR